MRLKRIDSARAKAEGGKPANVKTAGAPAKNSFVVNVDFTIAGSYTQTKQSAEQLVVRLAELGALEGTRFDHVRDQSRPGEPMATFSTSIVLKTTAFP